jgi:hypothetical protein
VLQKRYLATVAVLGLVALSSCDTPQYNAQMEAQRRAENRAAYVPRNSLDFLNYDRRQRISDNPTTIVWCTMFPPTPGVRPITVPIVGKLTSGGKRPFASDPGPDGMYGSSGEYRYGFTPDGNMADIFNMASLCTTEPTVWQRNSTEIVVTIDPGLAAAGDRAEAQLKAQDNATGRAAAANTITNALGQ